MLSLSSRLIGNGDSLSTDRILSHILLLAYLNSFFKPGVLFELTAKRWFAGSISTPGQLNQKSRLTVKGNMHLSSIHETLREGYFSRWCHLLHWPSSMNYDETGQIRHLSFSHHDSWQDGGCVFEGSIVLLFVRTRKFSFTRSEGSSRSVMWAALGAIAQVCVIDWREVRYKTTRAEKSAQRLLRSRWSEKIDLCWCTFGSINCSSVSFNIVVSFFRMRVTRQYAIHCKPEISSRAFHLQWTRRRQKSIGSISTRNFSSIDICNRWRILSTQPILGRHIST